MYWLFNDKYFNHTTESKQKFAWQQGRRFKGEPGDNVIMFRYSSMNPVFTSLLEIVEVEIRPVSENNQSSQRNSITLSLRLLDQFKNEKEIQDYLYSFPRILYYRERLYRHFNRKYYRLTEMEFDAIVKDEIFVARSVIGTVLNSMHRWHLETFVNELVKQMPEILINKYRHDEVLQLLRTYLEDSVITPAMQLKKGYDIMEGVIEEEARQLMAFSDEWENAMQDTVSGQVNLINEFMDGLQSNLVIDNNYKEIDQKFEKIFKNRPLPIDLKI